MIPETSREALVQAMQRFDQELREAPDWVAWPQQPGSHRWAIRHDGQLYPVKHIISDATGLPTSSFSGGEEANGFARKYGLQIVSLDDDDGPESALFKRYAATFANLHSQSGETSWPATTLHRAPHKPILLLSVIDLISIGHIQSNRIELDDTLRARFKAYWAMVMPPDKRPVATTPFRYLATIRNSLSSSKAIPLERNSAN